jgi:hypothetical protein
MKLLAVFFALGIFGRLFGASDQRTLLFIDEHLARWDRFARGENELVPTIRKDRDEFEKRLLAVMRIDQKQGFPRLVYYLVLQVGAFVPIESEIGKEVLKITESLPQFTDEKKQGAKSIMGGYVYLWWRDRKADFAPYAPLEAWGKREMSGNFIKMYESMLAKAQRG